MNATEAQASADTARDAIPQPIFEAMSVPEGGIYAFESPWSVIHKLAWLNGCSPDALLKHYYFDSNRADHHESDWQWLQNLTWRSGKYAEPVLDGHSLSVALWVRAASAGCSFNHSPDFIFCRSCVDVGWHSLLHQWDHASTCLFHDEPLLTGCPRCQRKMDSTKLAVFGDAAYACGECAPKPSVETWSPFPCSELVAAFEDAGREFVAWHRAVADTKIKDLSRRNVRVGDDWKLQRGTSTYPLTVSTIAALPAIFARNFPIERVRGFQVIGMDTPGGCEINMKLQTGKAPKKQNAAAQLAFSELLMSIVRDLTRDLARDHGCVDRSHHITAERRGLTYTVADPCVTCPVVFSLELWRAGIDDLIACLCKSDSDAPRVVVSRDVLEKVLRSEFYLELSSLLSGYSGSRLELSMLVADLSSSLSETVGEREPACVKSVRAVVDYSEWLSQLPCRPLGPYPVR